MVLCDVGEDRSERADAQFVVVWNGQVMLTRLIARQPDMTSALPAYAVSKLGERLDELCPGNIPGKPHAGMTSSRT